MKFRPPAVAGQFYPGDKKELEEMLEGFLNQAAPPKIDGEIFGLLLPHAGYVYSGVVAAYGVKAIANKNFDKVIIIGDSHYDRFDGVATWLKGDWQTPLGKIEIEEGLAQKILSISGRFITKDQAHLSEHSIEVQLPFLQKTLKNFKILPIIFGSENKDWELLARVILENTKNERILIIASSDLSHYLPYEVAKEVDQKTLKNILDLQISDLEVCAQDAVKTLIAIAQKLGAKTKLLKYANSGDRVPAGRVGDKSQVVGYGAVAFYR